MNKQKLICAVLSLLLAVGFACAQETPQLLEPVGVQLNAVAAWVGEISEVKNFEGAVVPETQSFWFEQEGRVSNVHVIPGQQVKAGEPLITLDTKAEEERLEAVEKQIEQLETNAYYEDEIALLDLQMLEVELRALQNAQPRDDKAIALKQLDIEQKQLDMELNLQLRRLTLSKLQDEQAQLNKEIESNVLTAPFDGRVFHIQSDLKAGVWVSAYTPLVYLADDTRLQIESAYVSAMALERAHALYARIGGGIYAITPVDTDEKEYLSQVLAGETPKVRFTINAPDDALAAGKYAAVCMESDYAADALLVPANALYTDGGIYLYVMENGVRVRRDVKVGIATDWYIQIVEGLEEGELVYVKE